MNTEPNRDRTWQEDLQQFVPGPQVMVAAVALAAAFFWFYWKTGSIQLLVRLWLKEDDYQHGWFVLPFSLFLLWYRRDMIIPFKGRGSLWGLAFFGLWIVMQWLAVFFNFGSLPEYSMLPFFAGLALFVGGWQAALGMALDRFSGVHAANAGGSTNAPEPAVANSRHGDRAFATQTLGIPSMAQGHTIDISGARSPWTWPRRAADCG